MNLKEMLKQKIINEVLSVYKNDWAVLIYDASSAKIIQKLFTKTNLLSFNITAINHIEEDRQEFDFPAIYFVNCNSEISKIINDEFQSKKYSSFYVCSLSKPENLNQIIKNKVVHLNIEAIEERVFTCNPEDLFSVSNVIEAKLSFNYLPCTRQMALSSLDKCSKAKEDYTDASVLLIDRTVDLYTPLLHFFTFKSILSEYLLDKFKDDKKNEKVTVDSFDDEIFKDLRYRHIADVNTAIQSHISRLNRNFEKLNKKNVDTASLGKMVMDAPKNIKIKEDLEKYAKYLTECISKLEFLADMVEVEQKLATGYDKNGKKIGKTLDFVFEMLGSPKYSIENRKRLLYIVKAKGITFTKTECDILSNFGFKKEDLEFKFNLINFIKKENIGEYKYDISRYNPVILDLIENFNKDNKGLFTTLNPIKNTLSSLGKSKMISCDKKSFQKIIIVYVTNGLTHEECRIAYDLSESLGLEILIGSNKIIDSSQFIEDIAKNMHLKARSENNIK